MHTSKRWLKRVSNGLGVLMILVGVVPIPAVRAAETAPSTQMQSALDITVATSFTGLLGETVESAPSAVRTIAVRTAFADLLSEMEDGGDAPLDEPPAQEPPAEEPASEEQPTVEPPVEEPAGEEQPAVEPTAEEPVEQAACEDETCLPAEEMPPAEEVAEPEPEAPDLCPNDDGKDAPGVCGCSVSDGDGDGDGMLNCQDPCPMDAGNICGGSDEEGIGKEQESLAAVVAAVAEADVVLVDANEQPIPLASEESAELLSNADPYFVSGGEKYCYIAGGNCASMGCNYCNGTAGETGDITSTPLQDAIFAASGKTINGDTIHVEAGDYHENVTIGIGNKDVILLGAGVVNVDAFTLSVPVNNLNSWTNIYTDLVYVVTEPANQGVINDAIDLVNENGTVEVGPGTYNQNVVLDKDGVTLQGDVGNPTAAGSGPDAPILDGGGSGTGVHVTSKNTTLRGFFLSNFDTAVLLDAASGATWINILQNTIYGNDIGVENVGGTGKPQSDVLFNAFIDNGLAIVNSQDNHNVQYIDAQNNYWGCETGPIVKYKIMEGHGSNQTWTGEWGYIDWLTRTELEPSQVCSDCAVLYGFDDLYNHQINGGSDPTSNGFYSPYKININELGTCSPEEDCPTNCGYEGGTVPDGSCGLKTCAAVPAPPEEDCPTNCGYEGGTVPDGSCGLKTCAAVPAPPEEDCPTNCGYEGGTVPDGSCGLKTCAATDPCPFCGDGVVNQLSETCDDGNTTSGDGCSATCTIETPVDTTPVAAAAAPLIIPVTGGADIITAGIGHTCALTVKYGLECWGLNDSGQLGDRSFTDSNVMVDVVDINAGGIIDLVSGIKHTCALMGTGEVYCWGLNTSGQLGIDTTENSNVPVQVQGLPEDVIAISAGAEFTCAMDNSNAVWCWGNNTTGQLNDGTTDNKALPVRSEQVGTGVVLVSGGQKELQSVNVDGTVQLHSTLPIIPVTGLPNEDNIFLSADRFTEGGCSLTTDGMAKCWGGIVNTDIYGVLNDDKLSSGMGHACAINTNGQLICWGSNNRGQLGNGTGQDSKDAVFVEGITRGVIDLAAGQEHTCAILGAIGDETVKCWGKNITGQLGNGTLDDSDVPVIVK